MGVPDSHKLQERGELCRDRARNVTRKAADQAPGRAWESVHPGSPSQPSKAQPGRPEVGSASMLLAACQLVSSQAARYSLLLADLNPKPDHISARSLEGRLPFFLEERSSGGVLVDRSLVELSTAG